MNGRGPQNNILSKQLKDEKINELKMICLSFNKKQMVDGDQSGYIEPG